MMRLIGTVVGASLMMSPAFLSAQELDLQLTRGSDELREELTAALSVASLLETENATPQSLLAAAQADYARLLAALYDGGRFGPVISIQVDGREAAGISPFEAPQSIGVIRVTVDPGPRFRFGRAEIGPLADGTVVPETFQTGERAGTRPVREAATAGVSGWRDVGHAKARLADQVIQADHPNRELDVTLELAPGPRLRFGEIVVTGNDRVRRTRIREIAGIPQGAVFTPEEITQAERRLRQTGVFSSVAISEEDTPNADGTLDLNLQVAEQKPRRFGFGAELSSQEGGKLSAFWLHRNLFQGAERLRVDAEIAGIGATDNGLDYSLSLNYGRPATFTPDTEFFLTASIERLDEPGFISDQASVAAGLAHRFSDELEGRFSLGFRYIDTEDAFGEREFTLLTASVGAIYDTRDNDLNPTEGFYISATGTPFLGLDGSESGIRFTSDARAYRGIGEADRFVLAGRAQLGTIWGPSLSETVPDYLFYSGGGGTVRGHEYQSLGFTTASGEFTGGQSFAALSAELRANLRGPFGVVGFYDAGYITDDSGLSGESEWHAGAGVGLRYDTGIGPIRFDVATPVNGDDAGQSVEFYIGIGQAF
ncbi:autotransporter assembly complex protein TamA [Marivita hallyeonensis]|uniref:Autotransporter secretion outer membrane protein TamA n=1 Tax=Marivita hallyeonensis TaxID=996342 RepID=A0A1M5TJT9_9RHOB|nr:autotransporter assembly complex family protein [Marivita hallyeonensis]SHH50613.1 autotransporter secretion outer membrane protein TamA [Marivita hallyeonensis]